LALPINIILGWKGLPVTNTLAYHELIEQQILDTNVGKQLS